MKNFFSIAVLGGAVALAVLLAPPAAAQSAILRCNVPFAFAAGDRVVPAGEYRVAIDNGLRLFRIDSLSDNSYWIVQMMPGGTTRPAAGSATGMLRFTKYGAQYFLTGVWTPGAVEGAAAVRSRGQMESAKAGSGHEVSLAMLP